MAFSRQEYWSGLPFPSPGDLPDPETEPRSPALQADSLLNELWRKPQEMKSKVNFKGEDYMYGFWNQAQRRKTSWGWKWWQTLASLSLISHKLEILRKHRVPALWLDCGEGGSLIVWKFDSTLHTQNWSTRLLCPGIWAWQGACSQGTGPLAAVLPLWLRMQHLCGLSLPSAILKAGSFSAHSPSLSSSGLWFLSTP